MRFVCMFTRNIGKLVNITNMFTIQLCDVLIDMVFLRTLTAHILKTCSLKMAPKNIKIETLCRILKGPSHHIRFA